MVFEKLRDIICELLEIEPEEVTSETTLQDLGVDSLDLVDVVMDIEDEFRIEVDENALDDFNCVGDVVKYIEDKTLEERF